MKEIVIPYLPRTFQKICHSAVEKVRFGVIVAHRGFGKTVFAINHLIKKAFLKAGIYGFIAPYRKQAKQIAWDYFKRFTAGIPLISKNETELSIILPNGGKIGIYGADDPDSLRGIHWDGVIMDEVAQMKPEVWGEIIRPGLATKEGFAIFIGTPKGQNLFYELYQFGTKNKNWFADVYPVTKTRIFTEKELELARASMSEAQYAQEFLCDFMAAVSDAFIRLDMVTAAAERRYPEYAYYNQPKIMGVDIARFGDDISAITLRQGCVVLKQVKLRDMQNETVALAGRIAQEIRDHKPSAVFIDAGYNPGVIDTLRNWGYTVQSVNFGGKASSEHYHNVRSEMWAKMKEWIETEGSIPDDPQLKSDLIAPTYDFSGRMGSLLLESKKSMKERGLPSPDLGDSLALTFAYPVYERKQEEWRYYPEEGLLHEFDPFREQVMAGQL